MNRTALPSRSKEADILQPAWPKRRLTYKPAMVKQSTEVQSTNKRTQAHTHRDNHTVKINRCTGAGHLRPNKKNKLHTGGHSPSGQWVTQLPNFAPLKQRNFVQFNSDSEIHSRQPGNPHFGSVNSSTPRVSFLLHHQSTLKSGHILWVQFVISDASQTSNRRTCVDDRKLLYDATTPRGWSHSESSSTNRARKHFLLFGKQP